MPDKEPPAAVNGIIDLKDWDFKKDGILELKGEWKFKWMESKEEFTDPGYDDSEWEFFTVPQYWNKTTGTDFGYCWLRLKVINCSVSELKIYLLDSHSSYTLFINDIEVLKNGNPGISRKTTTPQKLPLMASLPNSTSLIIAWNIANYHDSHGGTSSVLKIGKTEDIMNMQWQEISKDAFIIGKL